MYNVFCRYFLGRQQEAQRCCASTSHNHNEERRFFVCSNRPFSQKLPPISSTLIHTDPI